MVLAKWTYILQFSWKFTRQVIFILSYLKIFVLSHRKHFSILLFALTATWWFLGNIFQSAFPGTCVHAILKALTMQYQYWTFMFEQLMQILLVRWQTEEKFWLIPNLEGFFSDMKQLGFKNYIFYLCGAFLFLPQHLIDKSRTWIQRQKWPFMWEKNSLRATEKWQAKRNLTGKCFLYLQCLRRSCLDS